jgi:FlaA1/EpsC-like NDP-sugar epimerase
MSLKQTTVLVTGGTGFLGRELGVRLKDRYRVVLAARNNAENQHAARATGCEVAPLDVTNIESVRDVFAEFPPSIVIHAAATKYVNLSEQFPNECIDVNVIGSQDVARVAAERAVDVVVGVSTDKAAPPCRSTYVLSKAMMERLFCSMDGKTWARFTNVRFGNVALSAATLDGTILPKEFSEMLSVSFANDTGSGLNPKTIPLGPTSLARFNVASPKLVPTSNTTAPSFASSLRRAGRSVRTPQ